ncbi:MULTISPECIES: exodeoxyribonuclease V subunit gamma [unclassified Nocardioides]|uniref:exodeoxyribonuclease V subunit gamma n=1 Tax=unclassified Nocardioides TaxID=2615069 RepID=UPI0000571D30|nr:MULTISPECIES: exodeoxyribonuclease V subunit gamma [unclassified Nocardioides]ABL79796.1 DNA helicase/exodeoxyribonuclease V, gamma subunit [Nocardioides sp. JS614]
MTLQIHRASRTDVLADALGDLLRTPLADPFAEEVVVVPAKGVERWLTQRLSHRLGAGPRGDDGVCAGVRFLNPRSLVSLLLGRERDDPWDPERLVWPLLATIDESLGEREFATLGRHLGHGVDGADGELRRNRRYSVALRLAHLFASYALQRPSLVTAWREGRDGEHGGEQGLPPDLAWQPELWRRLIAQVDAPPPDVRHAQTCAALQAGGDGLPLPDRLSLFGHTRIPVTEVALLKALGEHRDVHLFLPQPSPVLWDDLADLGGPGGVVPRAADDSVERVGHPLLASLGRDARELRRLLDGVSSEEVRPPAGTPTGSTTDPVTLLGWLQHDLRANHAPSYDERSTRELDPDDHSLQVHACHGPARQVDVLREVLVGLLEDDPTLEPRDVLVMCPDIETYAPLISAGFGLATTDGHPAHRLRVKLADRALTSTNPLLAVAGDLLDLAGGRVTASDVLDLAGTDPVRRRFGFTDDELDRVSRWVARAGVRWGLDEESRAAFRMERFPHNTWRTGLDRILLGVAMSGDDHHHLGRGLPLDDVASSEIDLAGRLAELVARVDRTLTVLAGARTVADWATGLRDGVRSLVDVAADDAWQVPQFERELGRAAASSHEGGLELRLADVRAMLESRLAGRPTRANFRTGSLTVATMVPMRSVPHRVVCLVGLDDGVFPRAGAVDGDDVLGRHPLTGERDVRSEDRQLLLDAVLAATEHLVITYSGADEQSGASLPPAVPLGEILDAADRTTNAPVRDRVLTRHPLQPYDARNFTRERPFSFDTAALAGARSARGVRREPPPLLDGPLPPRLALDGRAADVSLQDLRDFLGHPVRAFLRGRLDVATPFEPDDLADAIPVSLDSLEKWQIGDRLLRQLLAGQDPVAVLTAEQLAGTLPPRGLGTLALHEVAEECQRLWSRTADLRDGERRSVDVDVDLRDGRRLTGTVPGVYGSRVVSLGYSRLNARQRLHAWVDLLALSATYPDQHWTAHAVGKDRAGPKRALCGPLDHRAVGWLRDLVDLRDRGLCAPLPVPVKTGAAWADAHARELMGQDHPPVEAARREWETDPHNQFGITGEDADPYHQRVYGPAAPVEALLDAGLGEHAWAIWEPLLTGGERVGPL